MEGNVLSVLISVEETVVYRGDLWYYCTKYQDKDKYYKLKYHRTMHFSSQIGKIYLIYKSVCFAPCVERSESRLYRYRKTRQEMDCMHYGGITAPEDLKKNFA